MVLKSPEISAVPALCFVSTEVTIPPSRLPLLRPSCFSVRLERRFSVPACTVTERRAQRRSREARSRAEPRAAASSRRAWRARRALDLDGRCTRRNADQAEGVRTSASASHNSYRAREAETGSPSKSVTTTLSISVILLIKAEAAGGGRRRPAFTRGCLSTTIGSRGLGAALISASSLVRR